MFAQKKIFKLGGLRLLLRHMPLVQLEYMVGVIPPFTRLHISCHARGVSVTIVDLVHVGPDEVGI